MTGEPADTRTRGVNLMMHGSFSSFAFFCFFNLEAVGDAVRLLKGCVCHKEMLTMNIDFKKIRNCLREAGCLQGILLNGWVEISPLDSRWTHILLKFVHFYKVSCNVHPVGWLIFTIAHMLVCTQ